MYHSSEIFRSVEEICQLTLQTENKFGVKHRPLSKVSVDHFIPDELHLMLRITDVLLRNLIDDSKDKDDMAKQNNQKVQCIDNLVELIQSCGVAFNIWVPKGSTEIDSISLSGSEKIKLLKHLPEKLSQSDVLHENTK